MVRTDYPALPGPPDVRDAQTDAKGVGDVEPTARRDGSQQRIGEGLKGASLVKELRRDHDVAHGIASRVEVGRVRVARFEPQRLSSELVAASEQVEGLSPQGRR